MRPKIVSMLSFVLFQKASSPGGFFLINFNTKNTSSQKYTEQFSAFIVKLVRLVFNFSNVRISVFYLIRITTKYFFYLRSVKT